MDEHTNILLYRTIILQVSSYCVSLLPAPAAASESIHLLMLYIILYSSAAKTRSSPKCIYSRAGGPVVTKMYFNGTHNIIVLYVGDV